MSLSSRLGGTTPAPAEERHRPGRPVHDQVYEVRRRIQRKLADELGPSLYAAGRGEGTEELDARVREALHDLLAREETPLSGADRGRIVSEVVDEVLGHGPIESLLRDQSVTEVMVNGPRSVYVERLGRIERVAAEFDDEAHLRRVIDRICSRVGRRVDEASPMVDARLPDGSRVNAIVPPIAIDGSSLTIRRFSSVPLTVGDLLSYGTLTRPAAQFLDVCVRGRRTIIVSGGTGSGKTTILNILSGFIPAEERVVTIEDAAELQLDQEHVVRLETRPPNSEGRGTVTTRDLVRNALRMRPDRIVVGEVRDAAALDMLQAMNTGHDGSLTTLHANTPRDALARLETMVLMAGLDLPSRAIRDQIASAVDLILQVGRFADGTRRITHITEVVGMESDVITLQDLFLYDVPAGAGGLRATGVRPRFADSLARYGVTLQPALFTPDGAP
ncbi:type II secretion system protein E [Paractinoplanes deccanensis]|uniref:Type II secretion system protein E n=1 Tax=Paractinoplanes deccanensis TaxID=113561 RepID=A0ABQ3Y512_9ACTN|nr:CpaF family protein [Actinoplanes deccanensis]GID75087.1 type II secretion system protein E [Actinoplanes deccanensis]